MAIIIYIIRKAWETVIATLHKFCIQKWSKMWEMIFLVLSSSLKQAAAMARDPTATITKIQINGCMSDIIQKSDLTQCSSAG